MKRAIAVFLLTAIGLLSATWKPVKTWAGEGTKETESFHVQSREWRINWKVTPTESISAFNIGVFDENDDPVSMAASGPNGGEDTTYVRSKPGSFYLKIGAANVRWVVTIEDQR